MRIIIATDIYGLQPRVQEMVSELHDAGAVARVVSPFSDMIDSTLGQDEVYAEFLKRCGHREYSDLLHDALQEEKYDVVVGFSAGASATWLAAANSICGPDCHLICFYPTRIRRYLNTAPSCPATLIFPGFEEVFDVAGMAQRFSDSRNVRCVVTPFDHGFLNPLSTGYSKQADDAFSTILCRPEVLAEQQNFLAMIKDKL